MAHTTRAVDSAGRFRRYRCLTLFNYNSNRSTCDTFLINFILPLDNCRLLPTPKETPELNLSADTLRIWSLCTPTTIFFLQSPNFPKILSLFAVFSLNRERIGWDQGGFLTESQFMFVTRNSYLFFHIFFESPNFLKILTPFSGLLSQSGVD